MFPCGKCIQTRNTALNSVQTRLRSRRTFRQPLVHAMPPRWTNPSMVLTFVLLSSLTNTVQTKPIQNAVSLTDPPVPEQANTEIQEQRARITSMLWLQNMDPIANVPTAKREKLGTNPEHIGWYYLVRSFCHREVMRPMGGGHLTGPWCTYYRRINQLIAAMRK
ncbi:hypothetical protein T265_15318, partial [Opisthorchis viverrini]